MTFGINIVTKFISKQFNQCYITQTLANDSRVLVYVIVWVAIVFGINCASNAGRKLVIVRGTIISVSCLHYECN